jgi:hypothetical protein
LFRPYRRLSGSVCETKDVDHVSAHYVYRCSLIHQWFKIGYRSSGSATDRALCGNFASNRSARQTHSPAKRLREPCRSGATIAITFPNPADFR